MQQLNLIHESWLDALKEVVRALGGIKKVAPLMRPAKSAEAAETWLKDCLNAERREKFDDSDYLWLMREGRKVGCHVALHFCCEDAGYERARAIEPKDEAAELQRAFIDSVRQQQRIADRLGQLGVIAPLKSVA